MPSDITFDGDWVNVDGNWTRLRTLDLMLDAPSRRIAQSGHRRAMVHDVNDRLTINYAGDYPNGVRINGQTSLQSLYVDHEGRFTVGVVTPKILLGRPAAPPVTSPGGPPPGGGEYGVDVGTKLQQLENEIVQLRSQVAALEQR
jgi:hypothetical protein